MLTNDEGKNKKGNDEMNRLRRQTMALPDGIDKQRERRKRKGRKKRLLFWFSTANNRQSLKTQPIRKEEIRRKQDTRKGNGREKKVEFF